MRFCQVEINISVGEGLSEDRGPVTVGWCRHVGSLSTEHQWTEPRQGHGMTSAGNLPSLSDRIGAGDHPGRHWPESCSGRGRLTPAPVCYLIKPSYSDRVKGGVMCTVREFMCRLLSLNIVLEAVQINKPCCKFVQLRQCFCLARMSPIIFIP